MSETELIQWSQIKGLAKSHLDIIVEQRQSKLIEIKALKEQIAKLDAKILGHLLSSDVKTVAVETPRVTARVTIVPEGKSQQFDKKKAWTRLLELGVREKIVSKAWEDSTVEKPRSAYLRVSVKGEEEE